MEIRRLTSADRHIYKILSDAIVDALDNKDLLIPMTQKEADVTFANRSEDIVLGGFVDGKLVATLALLHDIEDYQVRLPEKYVGLRGAEIGEAMVLPEYRRCGFMNQLGIELEKYIQNGHYDFILATAHPDNTGSNHWIQNNGFTLHCIFSRRGYPRNFYLHEL